MSEVYNVKIGEMKSAEGDGVLVTYALGSCVAVCLIDAARHMGALAHVLLPGGGKSAGADGRYADFAIKHMFETLLANGAEKQHIVAKICGGARMFPFGISDERYAIGERNIASVTEELRKLGIRIVDNQTGGTAARTMRLNVYTGEMIVTTRGKTT